MKSSNSISKNIVALLFAAVLGLLSISAAHAQVPTGAYSLEVEDDGPTATPISTVPGKITATYSDAGGTATAKASISVEPVFVAEVNATELGSSLNASAVETWTDNGFSAPRATATAELDYSFEVVGPAVSNVPLLISGLGGGSSNVTLATATSKLEISDNVGDVVVDLNAGQTYPSTSLPNTWSVDEIFAFTPNTLYSVDLAVSAQVVSQTGGTASAYIDPTISIDPTFAAANPGYSLVFSPNFVATPEPSTYALMLGGLAFLVFCARRKAALVK